MIMTKRPTLKTLAQSSGVSVATASQVIRGVGRISDHTRKKVLFAAKKINYIPDARAASMRSGERREIGMIIHELANPFNAEVVSGVSDYLDAHGYFVSVLDSRDNTDRQGRNIEAFIRSSRGGLIWVPAHKTPPATINLLKKHGLPTITFLRRIKDANFDHIGIENAAGTQKATDYLIRLGHRKIAFFGGHYKSAVSKDRIAGYQYSLRRHGISWKIIWPSEENKLASVDRTNALFKTHPDITALVCNGDMVALGACHALQAKGLVLGKDVSVIGFDDVSDASLVSPRLTTIALKPYNLGKILAKTVLDRINDIFKPPHEVLSKTELVIRGTTGLPHIH